MLTRDRAIAVVDAFGVRAAGYTVERGARRLVFDRLPAPVRNGRGEIVGIDVMVRLIQGSTEIPIDPHRIVLTPPTVPRANLRYEEGVLDGAGRFLGSGRIVAQRLPIKGVAYRRIVGSLDPEAAAIEAVWDSVEGVPNAPGWRTRGSVSTFYATAPGGAGNLSSKAGDYASARTGSTLTTGNEHTAGQYYLSVDGYSYCLEGFLIFDSSALSGQTVSAVVLSLDGSADNSTADFVAGVAASTYNGGPVVAGDWVSGAAIPTPELATWNSSGYSAGYNAFTETASFKTAINVTGNTSLILYSQRHRDNSAPALDVYEAVSFIDADAAGTTTDPKMDITHAGAAQAATKMHHYRMRRR